MAIDVAQIEGLIAARRIRRASLVVEWLPRRALETAEARVLHRVRALMERDYGPATTTEDAGAATWRRMEDGRPELSLLEPGKLQVAREFTGGYGVDPDLAVRWVLNQWTPYLSAFEAAALPIRHFALIAEVEASVEKLGISEYEFVARYVPVPSLGAAIEDAEFRVAIGLEKFFVNLGLSTFAEMKFTGEFDPATNKAFVDRAIVSDRGVRIRADVNTKRSVVRGLDPPLPAIADLERAGALLRETLDEKIPALLRHS